VPARPAKAQRSVRCPNRAALTHTYSGRARGRAVLKKQERVARCDGGVVYATASHQTQTSWTWRLVPACCSKLRRRHERLADRCRRGRGVGVSPKTVLRYIERGELTAVRLPGGQLRISQVELAERLASWATATKSQVPL
jgi:excisionase family DNA binding protein